MTKLQTTILCLITAAGFASPLAPAQDIRERMRATWPMLVSDSVEPTQVEMTGSTAALLLGGGTRFTLLEPPGVPLVRSGKPLGHRNGTVEAATAEFSGKRAVYRIEAAPQKPNLIWIMADDLGYGDLGCYGQKVISTPHLDRMAREGMRFTHYYAGATVCAPSRSVLMTGLHHGHTRVRGNAGQTNPAAQALQPGDVTVAGVLQNAGYKTALIGKWGLGDIGPAESGLPRKHGFDSFFGYLNPAIKPFPPTPWQRARALHEARPDLHFPDRDLPRPRTGLTIAW